MLARLFRPAEFVVEQRTVAVPQSSVNLTIAGELIDVGRVLNTVFEFELTRAGRERRQRREDVEELFGEERLAMKKSERRRDDHQRETRDEHGTSLQKNH